MATILLTAVGTAIGGPIGGAIGALAGQGIDNVLFAPPGREGPRLADLSVQTSQYGNPVPAVHGTMRMAGTVIWATDLIEHSQTTGGGKGKPKVTSFSYSVSLAVALSSRPIARVGRIWADGNVLRGAAGDFKSAASLRVHTGHDDQSADPLIASAENSEAPAHRGLAYAVLEDFDLAPFGNRIPSLTFEVVADDGAVTLTDIINRHVPDVEVTAAQSLQGVALSDATLAQSLGNISASLPLVCSVAGRDLLLAERGGLDIPEGSPKLPAALASEDALGPVRSRSGDTRLTNPVELRYYDVARDYQSSLQRAGTASADGRITRIDLPACLDSLQASQIARNLAFHRARSADALTLDIAAVDPTHLPGQVVRAEGHSGLWQSGNWTWSDRGVRVELRRFAHAASVSVSGSSGRSVRENDYPVPPSVIRLVDLPALSTDTASSHVHLAGCGDGPGWRGGDGFIAEAGGALTPLDQRISRSAPMGSTLSSLDASSSLLSDNVHFVDVQLFDPLQALGEADDIALAQGANLALIGTELVQFGYAEALGSGRYRLAGLMRGRGATDGITHLAGEEFLLLDERAVLIDLEGRPNFAPLSVAVTGKGDAEPITASLPVTGSALVPLPPVHLRGIAHANGDLEFAWVPRPRGNWIWSDGTERTDPDGTPAYHVTLSHDGQLLAETDIFSENWTVAASALPGLALPATLILSVRRIGALARSAPATASYILHG